MHGLPYMYLHIVVCTDCFKHWTPHHSWLQSFLQTNGLVHLSTMPEVSECLTDAWAGGLSYK